MNGFLYTLTLEEPVLANSLGGEPNSADSLFYIPGGLLRGALINAYDGTKEAANDDFARLFLNGETRYLNAYPLHNKKRALPIPVRYKKPKALVSSNFGFIKDEKIKSISENWQVNLHTQRDAEKGRATEEAGAVFRYIALPAGLILEGAILTANKTDAENLETLLKSKALQLGKARSAGYGHVSIETSTIPEDWHEAEAPPLQASKVFTLTLLSPALIRDDNGQFGAKVEDAFKAHFGENLKIKAELKTELVGGFNRKWGLPLPQQVAISAGSIFTITTKDEISPETMRKVEESGIGERRAEGFGRVAVNLSLPDKDKIQDENWLDIPLKADTALDAKSTSSLAENDKLAQQMLKRLLRRDLDQAIITAARKAVNDYKKDQIPNSQLSRWRTLIINGLSQKDPIEDLKQFKENAEGKSGWNKMQKARIEIAGEQTRLTLWIEDELLQKEESLSKALGSGYKNTLSLGDNNSITVDKDLNEEYRLRLLEAVLGMMSKTNSKGGK
jgi:CRISPR-associated protein Csx10